MSGGRSGRLRPPGASGADAAAGDAARLEAHNREQRDYFRSADKATMRPRESRYLRRHADELARFARLAPGERVLEVGCGMGRYTGLLLERGLALDGLDLSGPLLARLQERLGPGRPLELHEGDLLDHAPRLEGRFDAVVGFFMLHHLHDLGRSFAAMARMLRPGGRVAFLEPNPWNPLYYVQIALTPGMRWRAERGLLALRPRVVFPLLERAALARPRARRFGFFPPFLADRGWGARVERALERVPAWERALPFQMFAAERP